MARTSIYSARTGAGSPLGLTIALAVLLAAPAAADCLTGAGSTGFESGSQTYGVTLVNSAPVNQIEGVVCEPNSGTVDPGTSAAGAGKARFTADYGGYSLHSSITTGAESTGTGYASAGGTASWAVRVDSLPGYAGPGTIDVVLTALFDVSGAISVSGAASAGGAWNAEYAIKPWNAAFWTSLLVGNGALAASYYASVPATTSIQIDTDYIVRIHHNQSVLASAQSDPDTGVIGTAASGGTSNHSFGVGIAPGFEDPLLQVHFPIEDVPGGYAPYPGSAPGFPAPVPSASLPALAALAASLLGLGAHLSARRRSS